MEKLRPEQLREKANMLPLLPGVYIMLDEHGEVIYIGKAKALKNRVTSYFRGEHLPKVAAMVAHVADFNVIVVQSEFEALVLENSLIKLHKPKYNILLKDDKGYPFVRLDVTQPYPTFSLVNRTEKDGAKYFGPYGGRSMTAEIIDTVCKTLRLPTCTRRFPRDIGRARPCLNYHIHQCNAPCQGYISKEEYRQRVDAAVEFLNGNYAPILKSLQEKMMAASEEMQFEKAIEYRDLLNSVKQIAQKQKITHNDGEDKDIIALAADDRDAVVQVFFIRDGKLIGRDHFYVKIGNEDTKEQILTTFVKQFYSGTPFIPREIMLPEEIDDHEVLAEWLGEKRGGKVYIRIPQKGMKEKLVELAQKNAELVLSQDKEKIKREEGRTIGAMKEIAGWLDLPGLQRVEAFDISNINGFETVGSMVVYEKGKPKRSDYRKFKLRTVTGPDDYASMHEVLTRRFTHGMREQEEMQEKELGAEYGSFTRFPDLIMMDGGRGQVNICLKVLDELHLNIPVCGMVKDDNHRTRGLYYNNIEIPIDRGSEGFKLITRIQDEAHRFAIEYHRSLRSKEQVHSILDDIPGIGPSRRKALMKKYQSLEAIRETSAEDLADTESMNEKAAQAVYEFLHKDAVL